MSSTTVETDLTQPDIAPDTAPSHGEPGDHERLSHYVDKDALMEATVHGTPCIALCGKVWVPTRDGKAFPVCPECAEIYETRDEG